MNEIVIQPSFCSESRGGRNGYMAFIAEYGDTRGEAHLKMQKKIEQYRQEGAKAERERVATREAESDYCPPEYKGNNCNHPRHDCKKCWLDWLEADEIV